MPLRPIPSGPPILFHFHVTKCNLSHFICTYIIIYTTQIYCGRWHRLDSGQEFWLAGGGGAGNYGGNEWRLGMSFRLGCWEGFIKYGASLIWGLRLLTASGGDNGKGKTTGWRMYYLCRGLIDEGENSFIEGESARLNSIISHHCSLFVPNIFSVSQPTVYVRVLMIIH